MSVFQPQPLMYNPNSCAVLGHKAITAEEFRKEHPEAHWHYNPWTGNYRTPEDLALDPYGNLIVTDQSVLVPAGFESALNKQVGGEHYKKHGELQPWKICQHYLTPEEFKGYMKGNAIVYLLREAEKNGREDIEKAAHTLEGFLELSR